MEATEIDNCEREMEATEIDNCEWEMEAMEIDNCEWEMDWIVKHIFYQLFLFILSYSLFPIPN